MTLSELIGTLQEAHERHGNAELREGQAFTAHQPIREVRVQPQGDGTLTLWVFAQVEEPARCGACGK